MKNFSLIYNEETLVALSFFLFVFLDNAKKIFLFEVTFKQVSTK